MSNYLNEASPVVFVLAGPGDTQGAIEELFASTVRKSGWLWIFFNTIPNFDPTPPNITEGRLMKMNIYTGPAGGESVVMCRVPNCQNSTIREGGYWNGMGLPWVFNQGVRVSCSIATGSVSPNPAKNLVQFRLIEKPI